MMYPGLGSAHFSVRSVVSVPDGRKVVAYVAGHYERNTNATVIDDDRTQMAWADSGDDLTVEEMNADVAPGLTLYEYVLEHFGANAEHVD